MRAWAFKYVKDIFKTHNLTAIATPTVGVLPPPLTSEAREEGENNLPLSIQMMKYIFLANFLGMPGYSIPVGYVNVEDVGKITSLPIGFHLLGNHWTDHKLLRLGNALDHLLVHLQRPLPKFFTDNLRKVD